MTKIRGKNEGSIHKREDGSWRAQISLQGKRLSFSAKTRKECQDWIKKTTDQIDHGLTFDSTTVTLGEYLASWLVGIKISRRYTSWLHYDQMARTYIIPRIGALKIKDLRTDHIQNFYNQMIKDEVGIYTIIKIHTLLHSALEQAIKTGLANRNVTNAAVPPKKPETEMKILDESQVSQLLLAARNTRFDALLHLAVSTGMRQMELLGLKWSDVDWVKQTIKVERQLARFKDEEVQFTQPKTRNGRRTVDLGDRTLEALRRQSNRQFELQKKAGDAWQDNGLIFTTPTGAPQNFRNLLRDYKKLLKTAGVPEIRFHDLRHTAASLMLNHGIPVIVVSRRLGHAKPSITLDVYGHLIPSMQAEAAQKIDEWISSEEIPQMSTTAPELHRNAK